MTRKLIRYKGQPIYKITDCNGKVVGYEYQPYGSVETKMVKSLAAAKRKVL